MDKPRMRGRQRAARVTLSAEEARILVLRAQQHDRMKLVIDAMLKDALDG